MSLPSGHVAACTQFRLRLEVNAACSDSRLLRDGDEQP